MKRWPSARLGAMLCAAATYGQTTARPPVSFVDRGACPGECCTYGSWRVLRATPLYAGPSINPRAVGRLAAGSVVEALTGEVHTKAGRFVVRKSNPPYAAGEVIWVYTYRGEGGYTVWRDGHMVLEQIDVTPQHPNPDDWGYFERIPESTWWVRLRRPDGSEGWTNAPQHFSGTNSCG